MTDPTRPLLPDQPPPQPGHGDVIADLLGFCDGWAGPSAIVGVKVEMPLELLLDAAMTIAAALCDSLGIDLREAILERREVGLARYGQPLRYGDGRTLVDAAQEAIDLAAYLLRELGPPGGER